MKHNERKFGELLQIENLHIGNNSEIKKYKTDHFKKGRKLKFHIKENINLKKLKLGYSISNNLSKNILTEISPRHNHSLTNTMTNVNINKLNSDLCNFDLYNSNVSTKNLPLAHSKKLTSSLPQHKDDLKPTTYSLKDKLITFTKSEHFNNIENKKLSFEDINRENLTNVNFTQNSTKENSNANFYNSTSYNTSSLLRKNLKQKIISTSNNSSQDQNIGTGIKTSNNCSNLTIIHSDRYEKEKNGNFVEKITSVENRDIIKNKKFINVDKHYESRNLFKNKLKKKEKNELDIRKNKLEIMINKNFTYMLILTTNICKKI
jgi:hypothetical protein